MELKLGMALYPGTTGAGFNRTFMELKRMLNGGLSITTQALIGPLWN